jgi:hypothetical protein
MTREDLEWLEREKFTLQPGGREQDRRAAHNARIDRILAVCRRAMELDRQGDDGGPR